MQKTTAQNIVEYQYWFDNNYNSNTLVNISPNTILDLNTSLTGTNVLSPGSHNVNFRAKDNNGKWSTTITEQIFVTGNFNIDAYEYWFDNDYASKITTTITSPAPNYILISSLSTASVNFGSHNVNFRAKDSNGKWSTTITEQIFVSGNFNIEAYEYWFDNDYASKITTTITSPALNYILTSSLNTASVNYGSHLFNFRTKDSNGKWSVTITEPFFKSLGAPQLSNAEYWIDGNFSNRQPLTFTSNNIVFINQNILISNLDDQLHTFNFRMQDEGGKWSVVTTSYFMSKSLIDGYEYWFDSGYSNKKVVAITPAELMTSQLDFDASGETPGFHVVYFRAKNTSGKFSIAIAQNITVYVTPTFNAIAQSCSGEALMALPTTSNNGILGSWSPALNNLATTTYSFTPNVGEFGTSDAQITIPIGATSTWNGTSWSNGIPISTTKAIISSNYSQATDVVVCGLEITGNAIVSIPSGFNFTVTGRVTVAPTASLTFQNNSNLIQIDNVINVGNINVKRNANMRRQDYVYWGSPVAGQFLKAFSPQTLDTRFYTYNENANTFSVVANPATTLFEAGKGNAIRAPNDFPLYNIITPAPVFNGTFTGIPNNGNYSVPIAYSGVGFGYNFLSNPYPSTINALSFLSTNPGTLYFWTHTAQGSNVGTNYASYNLTGGTKATAVVPNVGSFESETPSGIIQIGQGFIHKTSAVSNAIFNNSMRDANNNGQFFKTTNTIEKNRIWFRMTGAETSNQILLGYMTNATNEVDESIDGIQIATGSAISTKIEDEKYVIQGRSLPFDNTDVVPLHLKIANAGSFTLNIDEVDGLFTGDQNIFVRDNLLNITHNIKENPYTFASEMGEFANRFEIIYQNSTLGNSATTFSENSVMVYKKENILNVNSGKVNMKSILIFDIRGRLILEKNNVNSTIFSKNLKVENQVLIVKIKSENGSIVTKKIIY